MVMMITLKQMLYFPAVCRTKNITKAAEELYISQPALSLSLKDMERDLGVQLFARQGNRLQLTEAGEHLMLEVEPLLRHYEQVNSLLRSEVFHQPVLRFGFSSILGSVNAPELIRQFMKDFPEIHLQTTEDHGPNLLHQLEQDQLDIILTGGTHGEHEWKNKFESISTVNAGLSFFVPAGHPLAARDHVTPEEISQEPLIMLDSSFYIAKAIEDLFARRGLTLHIILRTSQIYTAEQMIAIGTGAGFLPASSSENRKLHILQCKELQEFAFPQIRLYWKDTSLRISYIRKFLHSARTVNKTVYRR